MTERRPLVQVAGEVKELPSGDSLPGGGGGLAIEVKTASFTAAAGTHYLIRLDAVSSDLVITWPSSPSANDKLRFSIITSSASSHRAVFEATSISVNSRAIYTALEDLSLMRVGDTLDALFEAFWGWSVTRASEGMPHHNGQSIVTHAHASASGHRLKATQPGEYAQGYVSEGFGAVGSCGRMHLTLSATVSSGVATLVIGELQDIYIPPYATCSFEVDVTAVEPDYSVSTFKLMACVQNTGAGTFAVGKIYSPVAYDAASSAQPIAYDWNIGTSDLTMSGIQPTGPARDNVSARIMLFDTSGINDNFAHWIPDGFRIFVAGLADSSKIHAVMTLNKIILPPGGDCSEGSSE
jgi:hypothetical protein